MQEHEKENVNLSEGTNPWWIKGYAGWTLVTTSQIVCPSPCELICVLLSAKSNASEAVFYNGENATMPMLFYVEAGATVSRPFEPPEPILCDKGLYVVVDGDIRSLFVMWRPLEKGWIP